MHYSNHEVQGEIVTFQDYMAILSPVLAEKSNVIYLQVLDAKLESKDTLMSVIYDLHKKNS